MERFGLIAVVAIVVGQAIAEEVYHCPRSGKATDILRYCHLKNDPQSCHIYCVEHQPEPIYEEGPINCPESRASFVLLRYCGRRHDQQACLDACSLEKAPQISPDLGPPGSDFGVLRYFAE